MHTATQLFTLLPSAKPDGGKGTGDGGLPRCRGLRWGNASSMIPYLP
ncbi:MAG UNVERIFIED_CONTAM: hypothetical protein LVT10_27255 [Anaerolineae bacterium]|jgi:hypothetical protein